MSKITLFGIVVDDPEPVFAWLEDNLDENVVRQTAYKTVLGWHLKIAVDGEIAAQLLDRWSNDLWQVQVPLRIAEIKTCRK